MESKPVISMAHHKQQEFCYTRARYRQGRKLTSVKVYTVNDESKFVIVNGVPSINIGAELEATCRKCGEMDWITLLPDYPVDDFAAAFLVKFRYVRFARHAKGYLDGRSFFGGVLHVCYAPELETLDDTREKLSDRRKAIANLSSKKRSSDASDEFCKHNMPITARKYLSKLRLRSDASGSQIKCVNPIVSSAIQDPNWVSHDPEPFPGTATCTSLENTVPTQVIVDSGEIKVMHLSPFAHFPFDLRNNCDSLNGGMIVRKNNEVSCHEFNSESDASKKRKTESNQHSNITVDNGNKKIRILGKVKKVLSYKS